MLSNEIGFFVKYILTKALLSSLSYVLFSNILFLVVHLASQVCQPRRELNSIMQLLGKAKLDIFSLASAQHRSEVSILEILQNSEPWSVSDGNPNKADLRRQR